MVRVLKTIGQFATRSIGSTKRKDYMLTCGDTGGMWVEVYLTGTYSPAVQICLDGKHQIFPKEDTYQFQSMPSAFRSLQGEFRDGAGSQHVVRVQQLRPMGEWTVWIDDHVACCKKGPRIYLIDQFIPVSLGTFSFVLLMPYMDTVPLWLLLAAMLGVDRSLVLAWGLMAFLWFRGYDAIRQRRTQSE